MNEEYKKLVEDAKNDIRDARKHYGGQKPQDYRIEEGKKVPMEYPTWYDLGFSDIDDEELNLWNYWQGMGVDKPTLMVVGQDWGCIKPDSRCVKNICEIVRDPSSDVRYLSGCEIERLDFETDCALARIFYDHLRRNLMEERYPDLYFTNLCLGYRPDKTTGYFRQSWLTIDAKLYFRRLIGIKRPKVVVCLGRATSETAYKALTGKKLAMLDGFYKYIESAENGSAVPGYDGMRFYAMAHPGGQGAANRKSVKGGQRSIIEDWGFLPDCFD